MKQDAKLDYKFVDWYFKKEIEIPKEWNLRKLGDVCDVLDSKRVPLKKSDRYKMTGTIPYYGASGVIDHIDDYIFDEKLLCLAEDGENLRSRELPVAFTIEGKSWVNNHAHVLKPNKKLVKHEYLKYYLNYCNYLQHLDFTAQPKLNQNEMKKIKFVCPSLPEQHKIALVLSNVDNTLQNNINLIRKFQLLKEGIIQKLLVKGIKHSKFKKINWLYHKEIEIPEEWNYEILGKYAKIISGDYFPFEDFEKDGVPVLKIDNVSYGEIIWENISFLPKNILKSEKVVILKDGDIVIALNRPITNNKIKVGCLTLNDVPSILYQRVGKFEFKNNSINVNFFNHVLNSPQFKKIIERILIGSDQPYFKTTELEKQRIFVPSDINEQKQIASILTNIDSNIKKQKLNKSNLELLKKGLMQNLLTGKIRVKF